MRRSRNAEDRGQGTVIVGLGNPGRRYVNTPHNVGFEAIDVLASRASCRLRRSLRFRASMGRATAEGSEVFLVKPQTYMNQSGEAVAAILRYWKQPAERLLLVMDDADLELGRLRIRGGGGSAGHKGVQSVIDAVGATDFTRVRIGVGRDRHGRDLIDYVLAPFAADVRPLATEAVERAADAVMCILRDGVGEAMNRFNGPPAGR